MAREAYIYKLVLDYLETNEGLHSTAEIVSATNTSYASVARVVRKLAKERRVRKRHGLGHSYLYEFITHEVKSKDSQSNTSILPVGPIKSDFLRNVIIEWINNGWTPRSKEAAQTLVTVLSKIHQYYWAEMEHGVKVDQSDLDFCKTKLIEARDAAHNFAEFFDRLLATSELWDARKSAEYMLSDLDDAGSYVDTARSVSEVLR